MSDTGDTQPTVPNEVGPPTSGQRIGKYLRTVRLGGGGMGEVWKAWDTVLGRWVALKFLKGGDDDDAARFRREAQMAAKLSHPSIASVYDVVEQEGRPFISMQFIDGVTLKSFPSTDLKVRVRLLRDAARAVHVAHEHAILHRDLKPENLMASRHGGDWHVVVTDFGLARPLGGAKGLTVSGIILGTPGFMAPEQAMGKALTAATDVYGLGATLYALLTGRPPFPSDNVLKFLRLVLENDPVPPSRINPKVGRELEQVTMKCLAKEPRYRYRTAAALAEDLDRWLDGRPVEAHPPSAAYRLRKFVQRRPAMSAAFVVVLLAAVIGTAAWTAASVRTGRQVASLARQARDFERANRLVEARDAWNRVIALRSDPEAADGLRRIDAKLKAEADRVAEEAEIGRQLEGIRTVVDKAERMLYVQSADPAEFARLLEGPLARLEVLVARGPGVASAHALLGQALDLAGRQKEAELAWRKAVELEPVNPRIRYGCGRFLLGVVWSLSLDTAVRSADREARAAEALAHLEIARGVEDPVQRVVAEVMAIYAGNRFREAERAALDALAHSPAQPGLEDLHLVAALCTDDPVTRLERLTKALDLRPHFPIALLARAGHLVLLQQHQLAVADYDRVLRLLPGMREARVSRANALRRLGRVDEALAEFEAVLARTGDDWRALAGRAACRLSRGDPDGALADAESSLGVRPSAAGWMIQGNALTHLQRFEEAVAAYTKSLETEPGSVSALASRANARRMSGDPDGAIADCNEALRLDPGMVDALATRGALFLGAGDRERGIADLEEALRLARPDWPYRRQLEQHLRELKRP